MEQLKQKGKQSLIMKLSSLLNKKLTTKAVLAITVKESQKIHYHLTAGK
jgi:hypothetical protein